MFITVFLLFTLVILVYNYCVHYTRKGQLINLIPGPPGLPIVGNSFQILGTREQQWKTLIKYSIQYSPIFKFWACYLPIVSIWHPDDLETILRNPKHNDKGMHYKIIKPWLKTGLLTSTGAKWHSRRKILTPTFHFNILQQFVEVFINESENMTKSLKSAGGSVVKDLLPFLSEHTINAICETAMGTSLRDRGEFQQRYRRAIHQICEIFVYRLVRQWLHFDWIFSLMPKCRDQAKILKILHGFTEQIIAERKLYHERTNGQYLKNFDNDIATAKNDAATIGTQKKRLAMLDLLIAASREGLMADMDIREEVDTFMFEGHDTVATALCYILALLAEHKDIQIRVRNEVDTAMQENKERLTMRLLQQLPYLERCIKEALRLYPSVFFISRVVKEDVKLQSYLVPAGTTVHVNIYGVHRDPNFWPNPEIFDPDRFLPENILNRHPYSYIPFSAGQRNCIGQRFAMLEMKAMVASMVHNFYLEPVDYLKNLQLQTDLVLRPAQPLRIRFIPIYKINESL